MLASFINCPVKEIYKGAKNLKGIRCAVYKCAEEHQAYYSSLDRSKSIWYDDDSADLHIALWFPGTLVPYLLPPSKAIDFHFSLGTWYLRNPLMVKSGHLTVEREIEGFLVEVGELSRVLLQDYDAGDSNSPLQSLEEFQGCIASVTSCASALSLTSPVALLQSIERPELFVLLRPASNQKQLAKTRIRS